MDQTQKIASKSNRPLRLWLAMACLMALIGVLARSQGGGPRLVAVEFRGREHVSLEAIQEATGLKKGTRVEPIRAKFAVDQILAIYRAKGFELAEIKLVEGGKAGDTRVIIAITEGPWFEPQPVAVLDDKIQQTTISAAIAPDLDLSDATSHFRLPSPKPETSGSPPSSLSPLDPIQEATRTIRENPTSASGYRARSDLFDSKKLHFQAIADLDEAIRLDPGKATDWITRGYRYCEAGQHDQGFEDINYGLCLAADNLIRGYAYRCRASAHLLRHEYEAGLADYDRAIEFDPGKTNDRLGRGSCLFKLGEYDRAIADFEALIERHPLASHWWLLGECHFAKGDHARAEVDYDRADNLDPGTRWYPCSRALARLGLGHVDLAISDLNAIIDRDPDFAPALTGLGWTYLTKHDLTRAADYFDRALKISRFTITLPVGIEVAHTNTVNRPSADRPLAIFAEKSCHRPDLSAVLTVLKGDEAKTQEWKNPYYAVYFITRPTANGRCLILSLYANYHCVPESKSAALGRSITALFQGDRREAWSNLWLALMLVGEEKVPGSSRPALFEFLKDGLQGSWPTQKN